MSIATTVWICPVCGYVDDDTRDVRCARDHSPAYFAQAYKGERLRDSDGKNILEARRDA